MSSRRGRGRWYRCVVGADTAGLKTRVMETAGRFVPAGADAETVARTRAAVLISWVGAVCATTTGTVSLWLGAVSIGMSVAVLGIGVLCALTPPLVRRGVSLLMISYVATTATYLASFAVAWRTGGLSSPALTWSFLHPLTMYVVGGRRHALVWACLGGVQLVVFLALFHAGFDFPDQTPAREAAWFRVSAYAVMIVAALAVVLSVDSVRRDLQRRTVEAERLLDRQRILADMHDGLGGHLLSLLSRARAQEPDTAAIASAAQDAIDDLRLVVHALDPSVPSLQAALAELCWRLAQRCAAAGVQLTWPKDVDVSLSQGGNLQVLRAAQEMVTNALRHSGTSRIDLSVRAIDGRRAQVVVRDYGGGVPATLTPGRGLANLRMRATRLGGAFTVERASPGTVATLTFPVGAA